jgi:DNA (cytosine-5)-methyltransferase 1
MKYFSMFAGIGGFDLALNRKGHECVGYSEIDKYAIQVYNNHFKDVKNYGDATKIEPRELPDFDLLCAGFPCQAFSIAGKRRGFEDTRGTLFFEIARIAKAKRPSYMLLENVKGLLNHEKGETFHIIIQTLWELGYDVQWMVLNSKFFGVPQNRERVFFVCNLRGQPMPEILPIGEDAELSSKESSGEAIKETHIANCLNPEDAQAYRIYQEIAPTLKAQAGGVGAKTGLVAIPVLTPDRIEKRQNGRRFKEDGEPSFTLTGQDGHGVLITSHSPRTNDPSLGGSGLLESDKHCFNLDNSPHYVNRIRRLTPLECERLQGFPDGWTTGASDSQRYKMLGNAVTVNVVEAIMQRLEKGDRA